MVCLNSLTAELFLVLVITVKLGGGNFNADLHNNGWTSSW